MGTGHPKALWSRWTRRKASIQCVERLCLLQNGRVLGHLGYQVRGQPDIISHFHRYCLFGEWLWCQHGIAYDALPDFLSVFDIMERETGKFLDHQTVIQMIGNKFNVVPLLKVWQVSSNYDTCSNFVGSRVTKYRFVRRNHKASQHKIKVRQGDTRRSLRQI